MHLISRKVKGVDLPQSLAPDQVPPSFRKPGLTSTPPMTASDEAAAPKTAGAAASSPSEQVASAASNTAAAGAEWAAKAAAQQEEKALAQSNAQLKKDVAAVHDEVATKSKELEAIQQRIADLRAEEKQLRLELKVGCGC